LRTRISSGSSKCRRSLAKAELIAGSPAPVGSSHHHIGLDLGAELFDLGRAWLVGVLTGLLPCGWLWAFVVSAAGTAHSATGAMVMAVFWLGTVPAMTGVLALGGALVDRIRRRMPVISACVLIVLGVSTLASRWIDAGAAGATAPHCHTRMP